MLRMINVIDSRETDIFDMWRRIKDDKVKDPFQYMLRRINVVESKKKWNIWYVRKDKRWQSKGSFPIYVKKDKCGWK